MCTIPDSDQNYISDFNERFSGSIKFRAKPCWFKLLVHSLDLVSFISFHVALCTFCTALVQLYCPPCKNPFIDLHRDEINS